VAVIYGNLNPPARMARAPRGGHRAPVPAADLARDTIRS